MNALELVQRCANAIGIPQPSSVINNPDDDVVQLLELLNQEGRDLSDRHDWQQLTYEGSFTTTATESQGSLATIIGATQSFRRIVNETIWNRTSQLPVYNIESKARWQEKKALASTDIAQEYRIRGNLILFNPVPAAGESCYFEYVSQNWCTNSTGTTYRRNIVVDTDVFLLDDEIMLLGLEWRWLRKKGLSYAEEFATYEARVDKAIKHDGSHPNLSMDGWSS